MNSLPSHKLIDFVGKCADEMGREAITEPMDAIKIYVTVGLVSAISATCGELVGRNSSLTANDIEQMFDRFKESALNSAQEGGQPIQEHAEETFNNTLTKHEAIIKRIFNAMCASQGKSGGRGT